VKRTGFRGRPRQRDGFTHPTAARTHIGSRAVLAVAHRNEKIVALYPHHDFLKRMPQKKIDVDDTKHFFFKSTSKSIKLGQNNLS